MVAEHVSKWMTAEELGNPKAKTKVWIINGSDHLPLGQVRWYSSWRQYTFWPLDGTSLSAGCLSDLGRWVLNKTGEHMAAKRGWPDTSVAADRESARGT